MLDPHTSDSLCVTHGKCQSVNVALANCEFHFQTNWCRYKYISITFSWGDWKRETWHRVTCFSVRVDTSLCLLNGVLYELLIGFTFLVLFLSVSVRRTKLARSLVNVSAHDKNTHYHGNIRTTNRTSPSITDTRIAHASKNHTYPHRTNAKPARGASRHSSQQSSEVVASAAVADSDAPEVVAAGTGACLSSSFCSLLLLLLLSSSRGCRDSVWAPRELLTARRNCRLL